MGRPVLKIKGYIPELIKELIRKVNDIRLD